LAGKGAQKRRGGAWRVWREKAGFPGRVKLASAGRGRGCGKAAEGGGASDPVLEGVCRCWPG